MGRKILWELIRTEKEMKEVEIEKTQAYQIPIHHAIINYSKAFDLIKYEFMLSELKNQVISEVWINLITEMYTNLEANIVTDKVQIFELGRKLNKVD